MFIPPRRHRYHRHHNGLASYRGEDREMMLNRVAGKGSEEGTEDLESGHAVFGYHPQTSHASPHSFKQSPEKLIEDKYAVDGNPEESESHPLMAGAEQSRPKSPSSSTSTSHKSVDSARSPPWLFAWFKSSPAPQPEDNMSRENTAMSQVNNPTQDSTTKVIAPGPTNETTTTTDDGKLVVVVQVEKEDPYRELKLCCCCPCVVCWQYCVCECMKTKMRSSQAFCAKTCRPCTFVCQTCHQCYQLCCASYCQRARERCTDRTAFLGCFMCFCACYCSSEVFRRYVLTVGEVLTRAYLAIQGWVSTWNVDKHLTDMENIGKTTPTEVPYPGFNRTTAPTPSFPGFVMNSEQQQQQQQQQTNSAHPAYSVPYSPAPTFLMSYTPPPSASLAEFRHMTLTPTTTTTTTSTTTTTTTPTSTSVTNAPAPSQSITAAPIVWRSFLSKKNRSPTHAPSKQD